MAFRWRADDDPTLNAGLVVFENFRGSGPVLLRNSMFFCDFSGGGWGSGPPAPPPSGSALGTGLCLDLLRYTEKPFHRAHRLLYDTLRSFYRSTRRERERERELCVLFEFRHFF